MSKYAKLSEHLTALGYSRWKATFPEIEKILGFRLPESAYKYPAWWANQAKSGHSQTTGWRSVGWKTEELDLIGQRVTFVRHDERKTLDSSNSTAEVRAPGTLTIAEAKAGLAAYFKVAPEMIEITIKG